MKSLLDILKDIIYCFFWQWAYWNCV